ncbi:MAG: hypothetical protein VX589_21660 [Myxococcota bacterium]|nr:hypothetical protein [Myxococcota bacterium]
MKKFVTGLLAATFVLGALGCGGQQATKADAAAVKAPAKAPAEAVAKEPAKKPAKKSLKKMKGNRMEVAEEDE